MFVHNAQSLKPLSVERLTNSFQHAIVISKRELMVRLIPASMAAIQLHLHAPKMRERHFEESCSGREEVFPILIILLPKF